MTKTNILCFAFLFFAINVSLSAQDDDYEDETEVDSSRFSFGINVGAHFSNNNTAEIYTGTPAVTQFGIPNIFSQPFNREALDRYFRYPYQIAEYPFDPVYRTASEIGVHFSYKFGTDLANAIFIDFNTVQLKFEQFFTVAIDDPNNQTTEPTFERIPIFGRENRFHLNLGTQLSLHNGEASNAYFSLFGNINNVQMRRNYIVIDNREYEIFHRNFNRPNQRLGGIGYGGGAGLGFKFRLTDKIWTDFYYNLYYTQINLKEELQPFGVHHGLGLRVIWN